MVPLLGVGILVPWQTYNSQKSQAVRIQQEIGQRIAEQTTSLIGKAQAQLNVMSNDPGFFQPETVDHRLASLASLISAERMFGELAYLDTERQITAHVSRNSRLSAEQLFSRLTEDEIPFAAGVQETRYGPVRFNEAGEPSMVIVR